jgi:hypothetical protein
MWGVPAGYAAAGINTRSARFRQAADFSIPIDKNQPAALAGCVGTTALGTFDDSAPEEFLCPLELRNSMAVIVYDNQLNSVCPQSRCANYVCDFADRPCIFSPKGYENAIFKVVCP